MKEKKEVQDMFLAKKACGDIKHYKKFKSVDAMKAKEGEAVITRLAGKVETTNVAKSGDFIVRSKSGDKEIYIVEGKVFNKRYVLNINVPVDKDGYLEYNPVGEIYAFKYNGENFTFKAPWGEEMIVEDGDYIGSTGFDNIEDIYRVEKNAFVETYKEI